MHERHDVMIPTIEFAHESKEVEFFQAEKIPSIYVAGRRVHGRIGKYKKRQTIALKYDIVSRRVHPLTDQTP